MIPLPLVRQGGVASSSDTEGRGRPEVHGLGQGLIHDTRRHRTQLGTSIKVLGHFTGIQRTVEDRHQLKLTKPVTIILRLAAHGQWESAAPAGEVTR